MWLRGAPDHFFVPGDYTRDELERRRPGASAITTVTGIPINPVFARPVDRRDARARLGLDLETPFILVSSGFIGGGPVADVVGAISSLPVPCQVAVVCGSNRAAFQRVRIAAEAPGATTVRCEGKLSQDEFALRLQAADLVIGKPGGLTMSECLACGAPLIVYGPLVIPGQEEGNAEYLQQVGAGLCVRNAGELRGVVGDLLALPDRLARMRAAALAAAKPDAAGAVVRSLRAL
jgi:processive 1,2-diacylglycerol beta-glucosyltransferase